MVFPFAVIPFFVEELLAFHGALSRVAGVFPPAYPLVVDTV
jgi:hypothetical protein